MGMKIAFVVAGFAADENDWCIPAHTDMVRALATTHDTHVYTLRYPHRTDTYRVGSATIHSFGGGTVRGMNTARLWRRVMAEMTREHSRRAFDVIHALFGNEAGCLAVLTGKRLRVPSVVWLVNGELTGLRDIGYGADLNPRLRVMNQIILRFADSILCGCDALTERAHARMAPTRRARVETLPLGVNTTRFFPRSAVADTRTRVEFINVGSLLPVKDQATLLRAFALARREIRDAHLTIVGDGPLENELRALTAELEIHAQVTFAGKAPHEQLPALYHAADVFAQSSRHEGQGMALLEAAACGGAVCGTNVGALRDLAARDVASACAVGDVSGLAEVMYKTAAERARSSARVLKFVDSEYNLEQISKRLNALYARLACKEPD
jgi:glycosyltransferase involved in cell wall biosynthesis